MANTITIGDFEYTNTNYRVEVKYVGPTGRGSNATIPRDIPVSKVTDRDYLSALNGQEIETLVMELSDIVPKDIPALKHIIYDVDKVKVLYHGNVTIGKNVKEIDYIERADPLGDIVTDYGLPKRIEFLSPVPPTVRTVSPGSISESEIHVPAGAIDVYASHGQWKQAHVFIDADGKTLINKSKLKTRLEKIKEDREKAEAAFREAEALALEKAKEEAKQEKIITMGSMMHRTLGPSKLAKWSPEILKEWHECFDIKVTVAGLDIEIEVKKNAPPSVWDEISARFELIEKTLKQ